MVHALQECRRVLQPDGLLIDLRPYDGVWPLEVVTGQGSRRVGALDYSPDSPDDAAADAAISEAVRVGWFRRERATRFRFAWYWHTLAALETYMAERQTKILWKPASTREAAAEALASAKPGARLRIERGMLIGCYRRPGDET
jgi:hypothetical protein